MESELRYLPYLNCNIVNILLTLHIHWSDARVVEEARLESV